ncbi:MAG: sigma-70 family RNA polymerase sigma factor [candidate division WOR-3 bacterium]
MDKEKFGEEKKVYALFQPPEKKLLPLSEKELVRRAKEGDERAFADLVQRYEKRIYNLAYRMLQNAEDAADVLQETFLRAFRHLRKFKEKSSFYTWLYRIALNVSLRKLKKKKREEGKVSIDDIGESRLASRSDGGNGGEIPDYEFSLEAEMKKRRIIEAVHNALAEVPPEWRSVVILRDMEGLSNEEVADVLKISIPAVKSRLHRGRVFLRNLLVGRLAKL